jgi:ribosomal protein L32
MRCPSCHRKIADASVLAGAASLQGQRRWAGKSKAEIAAAVPHNGGRPKLPRCPTCGEIIRQDHECEGGS